jgi:hypothetical protein
MAAKDRNGAASRMYNRKRKGKEKRVKERLKKGKDPELDIVHVQVEECACDAKSPVPWHLGIEDQVNDGLGIRKDEKRKRKSVTCFLP